MAYVWQRFNRLFAHYYSLNLMYRIDGNCNLDKTFSLCEFVGILQEIQNNLTYPLAVKQIRFPFQLYVLDINNLALIFLIHLSVNVFEALM